ncbi:secreted Ly-6/uPAR domain-containing protein 2-like [Tachysurus fulvidraco]|uniref:secreted Ly-6/uPAR domain-containing protein 2-like n=1 Tax=Tachysurus fulvidraco TaxID=1234273 RepID=UPI000F4E38E1|nr:secreted Ly-6/uPAR domain-containing protein 2-like [Tachysurus fulvidraco]XP_047665705.1 secreted Ly-6/uPAR domain-containing protein 2-like [Tachysurus fulvidraco]XP_047677519.1 secreted Ly-6/uPAR domain-containing protein 2-like [Tachysurus fulvidraco]
MKMLLVTLALALLLTSGSALKCHKCTPDGKCSIVTCTSGQDTCVATRVFTPSGSFVGKRCLTRAQCLQLQKTNKFPVACCGTDLCNKVVP